MYNVIVADGEINRCWWRGRFDATTTLHKAFEDMVNTDVPIICNEKYGGSWFLPTIHAILAGDMRVDAPLATLVAGKDEWVVNVGGASL